MSAQQLITEHIDLWTSTIKAKKTQGRGSSKKRELYGIKKLRELILELAVRGKLVPQDPSDEPASVLLEHIAKEKAQLIKDKKIKKQKQLVEISEEEKPYDLPEGWEWQRLGELFDIVYGKGLPNSKLTDEGYQVFGANGIIGRYTEYLYENQQLLISCRGAYSGKPNVSPEYCYVTSNSLVLQSPWTYLSLKFLYYSLSIADKEKVITGSAQPQVTTTNLEPFLTIIPPFKEQHRIVTKVDELMALCDQLEHETETSLDAHNLLVDTLLSTLSDARDAKELSDNWARFMATDGLYVGNAGAISGSPSVFDTLITTDYAVEQLKQTILQLAVQGKLVPQDPNDEPASELLKRITAKKEQLVKDKKIKKQKTLPEITEEEKPFALPVGWEWERFGRISHLITDGAHHTPTYIDSGVPFLSVKDMSSGVLSFADTRFISKEQHEELSKRCRPKKGNLLLTKIGTTGVPIIIDTDIEFSIFVSVALIKFPTNMISGDFLSLLVRSPVVKRQSTAGTQGVGNKNLVLKTIATFKLAIPPLNEQNRIVTKVDELMFLCDQLKSQLYNAQTTQLHLSDAAVENALTA